MNPCRQDLKHTERIYSESNIYRSVVRAMQSKPVFNKRLYKAHAGITISKQTQEILLRGPNQRRSKEELRTIRPVVAGLSDIHKNFEFVKTALAFAVTYEKYESDVRIEKQEDETELSCYYILSGSVEAFYTVKNSSNPLHRSCEEQTISYTHVAGDYIGLLSADGHNFDLPPPESMATIDHSEFLRIDRAVFHEKIQEAQKLFRDEIVRFLEENALFAKITVEDRQKLVSQMVKQEFPAGKQILPQGEKQEHAFFIAEGRCVYYRRVFLPEQRRSELFKMGYIEKGSYFDATCIIDDQSSKFSVSAVGPVKCYLLNKWTIKNSESVLRALATNRPSFQTDREIESLIKESDQWQSYKRDTVCEAIAVGRTKTSRIIPQNEIARTLHIAIRQGALLRQQRNRKLVTSEDLDLSRRISGGSCSQVEETTEGVNTKCVVKAVMLMKRSRGSIQMDEKSSELGTHSSGYSKKEKSSRLQRELARSAPTLKRRTQASNYQFTNTTENLNRGSSNRSIYNNSYQETSRSKNISKQLEAPTQDRPSSSPIPDARAKHRKPGSEFDDRWVANDKKFKVKEVVNTRIPGKESPVDVYRRFEPSMFEFLDKMNNLEKEKAVDPFTAKFKARDWLRQARERIAAGGSEYNPGKSPIIVIEEYCIGEETVSGEGNGHESCDQRKEKFNVNTGSLETLLEDSDKENVAEEVKKPGWTTAVHETRLEAERCLERARSDIAMLEQRLVKFGWTRDKLIEKERTRTARRKRSGKSTEEKKEKRIEEVETEMVHVERERKKVKVLKRQSSLQKILEGHSRKAFRRNRSNSDEKPQVKRRSLHKRFSTGDFSSETPVRPNPVRTRTSTIY